MKGFNEYTRDYCLSPTFQVFVMKQLLKVDFNEKQVQFVSKVSQH